MKPFKFLNIAKDENGIDVYINGEIIDSDLQRIYDYFEIAGTSPKSFKSMLDEAKGKPLTIHINSIGGDLIAGMAMYSAIKNYKGETTAIIDSICASAATLPAMACKKVIMQAPSTLMIHGVFIATYGNARDLEKDIEVLKSLENSVANAYEEKTGISRQELLEMMKEETWMDAKKAKELGFIDEINGQAEIPQDIIQNTINNNKRLFACLRGFEQPTENAPAKDNAEEDGSKLYNGKFKSVEELERAYSLLESEYTKKCQELKAKAIPEVVNEPLENSAAIERAELELAIAKAKAKNILMGGK